MTWCPTGRRMAAALVCTLAGGVAGASALGAQEPPRAVLDADFYRRPYPQLIKPLAGLGLRTQTFETEPNDTFMSANPIVLGDTVGGDLDPAGDVDYFSIALTGGERVDFDIDAFGLGSLADVVITLYDTDGATVLDFSDNVVALDPRIVFEPGVSGTYYLAVEEVTSSGGPVDYFYLLKATVVPTGPGDPTTFHAIGLGAPMGTVAFPGEAFVVADALTTTMLSVDPAGNVSELASLVTTGTGPQLDVVRDVVIDAFGNMLVVGRQSLVQAVVWRVTPQGDTTSFITSNASDTWFSTLTVDRRGDLWVADQIEGSSAPMQIIHFDPLGRFIESFDVSAAGTDIFELAFSPAGELHFTNLFGDVWKLVNGTPVRVIQRSGFSEGIVFDVDGYLYLADGSVGKVLLYDPAYQLVEDPFAGTNLAGPLNMVFGRDAAGVPNARLFFLNFGLGLPEPFAGAMMEAAAGTPRAPGYRISDFLDITTDTLRSAPPAAPYADTIQVVGAGTASWSIVFGSLPPGLTLDGETGEISGETIEEGIFRFTVQVDDGVRVGYADLSITVAALQITADRLVNALFGLVTLAPDEFGFLDGRGNDNGILDVGDLRAHLRFLGTLPGDTASVQGGVAR